MAATAAIVKSDEGVGLQSNSTYYNKYVLPGWWVRLFYGEKGLAKYLSDGSLLIGVSFSVDSIKLSYPELVKRLDSYGYRYRLPRRWRKKYVKDWRRRSGVNCCRDYR